MGRGGRRASSPAPARHSSPPPPPRPAAAPHPQTHYQAPPQTHHAPPPQAHHAAPPPQMPQAPQKAPGLMAQMATTAGGVAAGSVLGHGISRMLWGGSSHSNEAQAQGEGAPVAQGTGAGARRGFDGASSTAAEQPGPCQYLEDNFDSCLRRNPSGIAECQFQWDQVLQCRRDNNLPVEY